MPHCCVCNKDVDRWLPHPHLALRSEFMKIVEAVGSDLTRYQCPACGCNDRERHLWLYMGACGLTPQLTGAHVLHMAPEPMVERLIAALQPARYVRGDLHPTRRGHLKLDAEHLPFDDASFDLAIFNHVLEHVAHPERALAELHRVLRPGGMLIAQTPYAPLLRKTFELDKALPADLSKLLYGQEDHVRLFGADIVEAFHGAGFDGTLVPHAALLAQHDAEHAGVNPLEPFFAFSKPVPANARPAEAASA